MKAKTLIVGGGVMGTSIAMQAARGTDPLAEPVVLVERQRLGAGSSGRSGAVLRQHFAALELAALARDSLRAYSSFQTRTGRRIGFERTGVLVLGGGSALPPDRLRANVDMMVSIGIDTRVVEAPEIRELVPSIRVDDDAVGAWEPDGGFVDPVRTVEQFAALARTYGAATRLGVAVERIEVEGGRVARAVTSAGTYEVEQVVVTAGPWSRKLLTDVGVELPLRVVRPEQHWVSFPNPDASDEQDDLSQTRLHGADLLDPLERISEEARSEGQTAFGYHPVVVDYGRDFYARCEPPSRTRIGRQGFDESSQLLDPDDFVEGVDPAVGKALQADLVARFPAYESSSGTGSEAGLYTMTPDALPVIGAVEEIEGLFVATGFSGHVFKFALSASEGMAQLLRGSPVSAFDVGFFSSSRFRGQVAEWSRTLWV